MPRSKGAGAAPRVFREGPTMEMHQKNIKRFLYDEGPHRVKDIATHIGLSISRTEAVVHAMYDGGSLERIPREKLVFWGLDPAIELEDEDEEKAA